MNDLNLAPTPSSSPLRGILIATFILLAGVAIFYFYPYRSAHVSVTHVEVYAAHTVFASSSIQVGSDGVQDDLYVLATVRVQNGLTIPIFLKDFTATLTNADGEVLESSAVEKRDMAALYGTFPALKAMASPPLDRETTIAAGASAEGMVLLHFPGTKDAWDKRKAEAVTVEFYHQQPITVAIR